MMLYPIMEAVRSGGDLENIGGSGKYVKDIVCPDGCVMFRLTARPVSYTHLFQYFQWNVKKEMELRHDGGWYHTVSYTHLGRYVGF